MKDQHFPQVILIDNANYCNLQCSMCDHKNMHRKKQIMPKSLYRKIISEIASESPDSRVWDIYFGDPFCCPDIVWRIAHAKDSGLTDVVLNTNGLAMYPHTARNLIVAGLDAMYVGIDAAYEDTYNKVRIGGNFDRVVNHVIAYRDLLEKFGTKDQKLFVQFVVSDINENEIEEFKAFWKTNRVNVKIRPKVSWAGIIDAKNLDQSLPRFPCKWAMESLSICVDGTVSLCAVDLHCKVPCGSVLTHSIKQIWNSTLKTYRDYHNNKQFNHLPDFCKNCLDWQSARCTYE